MLRTSFLLFFVFQNFFTHPFVGFSEAESPRASVEAAYQKACTAIGLKYLDGFFSIRAPGFERHNEKGELLDLVWDRQRYQGLLDSASFLSETYTINSVKEMDSRHLVCEVHQVIRCTIKDPAGDKSSRVELDSVSVDHWSKVKRGWRQQSSRIVSQSVKKSPI